MNSPTAGSANPTTGTEVPAAPSAVSTRSITRGLLPDSSRSRSSATSASVRAVGPEAFRLSSAGTGRHALMVRSAPAKCRPLPHRCPCVGRDLRPAAGCTTTSGIARGTRVAALRRLADPNGSRSPCTTRIGTPGVAQFGQPARRFVARSGGEGAAAGTPARAQPRRRSGRRCGTPPGRRCCVRRR